MTADNTDAEWLAGAKYAAVIAQDITKLKPAKPVDEQIKIWDALTRSSLSLGIMTMFVLVNLFTLGVIVWLGRQDQYDLTRKLVSPGERLISKDVLIALLGASTVQLGSIAVIMTKYVFKGAA